MKHNLIILVFLVILGSFIFLSVSFSQTQVGVSATVPVTDANREKSVNFTLQNKEADPEPVRPPNIYLYYFEKSLGLTNSSQANFQAQTIHDRYFSYGILAALMLIVAVFLTILLKIVDKYIINRLKR